MAQFVFVEWLALWLAETQFFRFEWDQGNTLKSQTKHGVSCQEVEELFALGQAVPIGVQVSPNVGEERLAVVGPTADGRLLTSVFTIREGFVRPISTRPANRKEKKLYEQVRQIA